MSDLQVGTKLSARSKTFLFGAAGALLMLQLIFPRSSEPYPAILLPAGGTTFKADQDTLTYVSYRIEAVHPDSSRSVIPDEKLLPFLASPVARRRVLLRRFRQHDVGLSNRAMRLNLGSLRFTLREMKATPQEVLRTRRWLQQRVETITGRPVEGITLTISIHGLVPSTNESFHIRTTERHRDHFDFIPSSRTSQHNDSGQVDS